MGFCVGEPGAFVFRTSEAERQQTAAVGAGLETDFGPLVAEPPDEGDAEHAALAAVPETWSAPGLSGVGGLPEHVPIPLGEYPTLSSQQAVASSAWPWSAVVMVRSTFPNGTTLISSGVMVGCNDVLTAGHVAHDLAYGGYASSITVVPAFVPERGLNGPYGSAPAFITAVDTQVDPDGDRFILSGNRGPGLVGSERDVALLGLPAPLGDATGWMGLDPAFKAGYANLSGYPDPYGNRLTNDVAYTYDDPLDQVTNLTWFEAHPGNSGGPVWHFGPDGSPSVVGILSSGQGSRGLAAYDVATSYSSILGWIASNDHLIA